MITIESYIAGLKGEKKKIVAEIVTIVRKAAPEATGSIKWSQPVFEQNGPFCYVRAFTNHVTFGFWRGVDLTDDKELLESGGKKMAHVKLRNMGDIKRSLFEAWIKQAVQMNLTLGNPNQRRK